MRKFTILFLLSLVMLAVNGENSARKISSSGRALSTTGKTLYKDRPRTNLMLNSQTGSFSEISTPNKAKNDPSKIISASGGDLQGYLKASAVESYPPGWYDINTNGQIKHLFSNTAIMGSCGYVRDGKICQFTAINSYGYYWFYYSEYSLATGEQLYEVELPDSDMRNYVVNCTYNEKEDMVYMQTYSKNFSSMAWSSFNPETHERTYLNNGLSWDENRVVAIGTNPRDNRIYGIKDNGEYVEIDRLSGNTTVVKTLDVSPAEYSQSMIYSPMERGFVWAAMLSDNTSGFYRIEPSTGETSLLGKMDVQNQFLMLYCPDKDAADDAPGLATFSASFDKASLSGTVSVTLPEKTFGGDALSSSQTVTADVIIDGASSLTLSGKPGQTVSKEITLEQGQHEVIVKCALDSSDLWGPERKDSFYTGFDTPMAPTKVRIHNGKILWSAPQKSVHDGYVDFNNIKYIVKLNDILLTETPVSGTSLEFEAPASLAIYYAKVYAVADGMSSEPGVSSGVKYGDTMLFPFSFTPTSDEFTLFTIVDGNNDGNSWKYFTGKDCVYYNTGSFSRAADEWLIFPLADFSDSDHLYRLTFDAKALIVSRPEDFEIWLLNSTNPETGKVKKLADFPQYNKDQWNTETFKFNVDQPGKYSIGFRCTTPEGFQMMLQQFKGEKTSDTMKAPAECKGVKLTGASEGKLEATASFIAPTKALDGSTLPSGKEITVFARTKGGEASVKVLPGNKGEITFPCLQGMNSVTIVTANDGGEGMENLYEIFAGQEKPGKVQNLKSTISDDNLTWTITWEAPVEGESGGYINPDEVGYYIYNVNGGELSFLEDIGTRKSYTYKVPAGKQSLQQIAVGPYNIAGAAAADTFKGTSAILGTPLQTPFTETFTYGVPSYLPNVISRPNSSYTAQWAHGDPTAIIYDALTPDYGAMYAQPTVTGLSLGRVEIPRVSTEGYNNICFVLRAFRFPQGGLIRILGRENNGAKWIEIGEFDCVKGQKGYVESIFKLPADLQNKPWISLAIEAEFDTESTNTFIIVDEYSLIDLPDNDMGVSHLLGTDRLRAGETGKYIATVSNFGKETQTSDIRWEVLDPTGNVFISQQDVVSPLDPKESEDNDFSFTADNIAMGDFATVKATVIADPDDSEANDSKEMKVALISAASGKVNDLEGTPDNGTVALSWSAPQMRHSVNDDFSSLEHGAYDQELGAWKNIDGDGKNVCSINGVEIPDAGVPKGWQVIDESLHPLFEAHKNSKMLLAMTPADESAANDWIISPEIAGGSELVFAAQVLTTGFAEEFEVLVSSTDDDITSFTKLASFTKENYGWQTYMVTLPADARYFAIRYCSVDQFGLLIDDIDYVPADGAQRPVTGYNVYRNDSKIGSAESNRFTDSDPLATAADYYVVPVVKENGQEKETVKSNIVRVDMSKIGEIALRAGIYGEKGSIKVNGMNGSLISVFAADGVCVASRKAESNSISIPVNPGVYMVNADKTTVKVIVK
ncbi:MAG: choice-of-anchor J domain-containing protein [Muribaculaceae bacterium]|nr:choice-of-anchor J domain-containing protein [Muribaculaceae bacterium]